MNFQRFTLVKMKNQVDSIFDFYLLSVFLDKAAMPDSTAVRHCICSICHLGMYCPHFSAK